MPRPARVLNEEKVREIRARLEAGETQKKLAAEFDVAQETISQIKRRVIWKTV